MKEYIIDIKSKLIIMGMLIYSLSYSVLSAFPRSIFVFSVFFMAFGLVLILAGIFNKYSYKLLYSNKWLNYLLTFFVIQCLIMIIRGFDMRERSQSITTYEWIRSIFFVPQYVIWVVMPLLAAMIEKRIKFTLFDNIIFYFCIFSIIAVIANIPRLKGVIALTFFNSSDGLVQALLSCSFAWIFDIFSFFFIIIFYIKNKKTRVSLLLAFITSLIVKLSLARRGDLFMMLLLLFFTIVSYSQFRKTRKNRTILIVFLCILSLYIIFQSNLSELLFFRGMVDSRSEVDIALYSSLSPLQWVFGGGLNGRYYCSIGSAIETQGYRYIAETGFSYLVLKGGLLMAVSYILLWLIPAFMGLFKSKNVFCKAIGLYLIWNVVYLYPQGSPNFSFQHFFVWFLAGLVSSKVVRHMSEEQIKFFFFR